MAFTPYIWKFSSEIPQPSLIVTNTYAAQSFPEVEPSTRAEIQKVRPVFRTEKFLGQYTNMDILCRASSDPNFNTYHDFIATYYQYAPSIKQFGYEPGENTIDDDGWATFTPNHAVGEFFKFAIGIHNVIYRSRFWGQNFQDYPEFDLQNFSAPFPSVAFGTDFIREFTGVEILYVPRGDF